MRKILSALLGVFFLCLVWTTAFASMLLYPKFQALDSNGDPLSGGLVYTYTAGTTTAKASYSDRDYTTANTNPVVLDSRGEAAIYLNGTYKIILRDSDGTTILTIDNVSGADVGTGVSGASGYIAVYNSTSTLVGVPEISGVSVTDGTITDDKLTGVLTKAIATTLTISAGVSVYELKSSTMSELSGTSIYSAYLTGVSVSTRSPTSGVSTRVASGTGRGENLVFFLQDDTAQSGNTIGVHFTSGDVIASADTITAGVSKYIMSGTTDAQIIIAISTGVSKWWVRTTGGPSVAWD